MVRLFMDGEERRSPEATEFQPESYAAMLERLADLAGAGLEFTQEAGRGSIEQLGSPIRLGGRRTGWAVCVVGTSLHARAAAETAAEMISRLLTADQDMTSLAVELARRYEELNFLYDMTERVGALLDEDAICAFAIEEAAWLLDCQRASIMLIDAGSGELRIRAAVGLPEGLPGEVSVKPGERISGKVFETGNGVIVNAGDPMPAESLNLNELSEANCFLSVPLKITADGGRQEHVHGVINLTRRRGGRGFTADDLKLVTAVADTAATQIHNTRLINAERDRQQLEHELELAARIQLSLLPKEPLRIGPVEVAGVSRPARHVGGDLFDYWAQDDRLCVLVADVSGHDIGAALMATALRSVFRSEAGHRSSVAGLLQQVNGAMFTDLLRSELLVSAFYAEIEPRTGMLRYCRAGHPKPLLMQDGADEWLDTRGLLLGLNKDGEFEERSARISPGARILLYTDGLIEAKNAAGQDFGTEGVQRAAAAATELGAQEIAARVVDAAREHAAGSPLADDVTAVVLRLGPPGTGR
jgi:sigma-B regulation protein RsbU (phosphoserine phosphatase)